MIGVSLSMCIVCVFYYSYFVCVCMRVCVLGMCVCMFACVCVCVCVRSWRVYVCLCVQVCAHIWREGYVRVTVILLGSSIHREGKKGKKERTLFTHLAQNFTLFTCDEMSSRFLISSSAFGGQHFILH